MKTLAVARKWLDWAELAVRDPRGASLAARVRARHLTYLSPRALGDLRSVVRAADADGVSGDLVECGCALGGSAIVLAASRATPRTLRVYDTFGMIPPPGDHDGDDVLARYAKIANGTAEGIGGGTYYGYRKDLYTEVVATFGRFGLSPETSDIHLVKGLFEDTLWPAGPIAVAHIDGDWYDSVKVCLERLWPTLSVGGTLVIDDYEAWSGCRTAVDEFTSGRPGVQRLQRARLHLRKVV
jgi:Macrocin-O-methyltransferase (TylF)